MEVEVFKDLIRKGDIKAALDALIEFVNGVYTDFTSDILLLSARYSQVMLEYNRGILPQKDYTIEVTSITRGLLEIIEAIESLTKTSFRQKKSPDEIEREINELNLRFERTRKKANLIQSNPTRLREKNDVAGKLGQIFINYPDLIRTYENTKIEGVIAGISFRYKKIPDVNGIDFFEKVAANIEGNFTKGCIANALAEIVYTGQIRIGDDDRILQILGLLAQGASGPVVKNIERVQAELHYFTGEKI